LEINSIAGPVSAAPAESEPVPVLEINSTASTDQQPRQNRNQFRFWKSIALSALISSTRRIGTGSGLEINSTAGSDQQRL